MVSKVNIESWRQRNGTVRETLWSFLSSPHMARWRLYSSTLLVCFFSLSDCCTNQTLNSCGFFVYSSQCEAWHTHTHSTALAHQREKHALLCSSWHAFITSKSACAASDWFSWLRFKQSIKRHVWFSFFLVVLCVCVFLGNFMELIQGGGLCLCEEGASQTSCLGFTLTAVLFMHVSHDHYPGLM